jgi:hypothetical protein
MIPRTAPLLVALLLSAAPGCKKEPHPGPFHESQIGQALLLCYEVCSRQDACGTVSYGLAKCKKICQDLIMARTAQPACKSKMNVMLDCWWRAAQGCKPEDACADEVGEYHRCMCAQPNAPPTCRR